MVHDYFLYIVEFLSVVMIIAVILSGISETLQLIWRIRGNRRKEETPGQRIGRLTNSLKEATQLISDIEHEIKARHELAEKLSRDIETYDQLVELKQAEVEAVAQLLRGELQVERRRSFLQNVAINSVFFILGAIVSALLTRGL